MNAHIVCGLFALYVAVISLSLVLAGHQDPVLAFLRRCWGRTRGHALYFLANVALPLLVCVLCLGWGVRHYDADVAFDNPAGSLQLDIGLYRDLAPQLHKESRPDPIGVVYGA